MKKLPQNAKPKLSFLINSLEIGGGERVITELANELDKTHSVIIHTLKPIIEYETPTQKISLSRIKNNKLLFLSIKRLANKYQAYLEKEKPLTSISFLDLSNIANIIACQRTKIYCVISIRSILSEVYKSGVAGIFLKRMIKKYYPLADLIIVNSQGAKQDLVEHFGLPENKIKIVYNPVDADKIQHLSKVPLPERYHNLFSKNQKTIVHVGRLSKEKGHIHLLRIFLSLQQKFPHLKMHFIGNGPLRKTLEQQAKKLGIEQNIIFLGNQKNPFIFLSRSDLFVLSSYYEGFPNAMLEAMALSKPVVSVDCNSGPREILAPDTNFKKIASTIEYAKYGVLTPPLTRTPTRGPLSREEKNLVLALTTLLNKPALLMRYSLASKKRIQSFAIKQMVEIFLKAIEH